MKAKRHNPRLVLQLQALREQIDDILDGGGGDISEKPAKTRRTRGPAGRKLAIVVGHSAAASGASGVAPISSSEYPWNKDLAAKIVGECSANGVTAEVISSRQWRDLRRLFPGGCDRPESSGGIAF